jgi:beta-lactamase superfamily II metal-dependent hydrolase
VLQFEDTFFPIGQGLFYSGTIHFTGKSERVWKTSFVFDCGSITGKHVLDRAISKFHKGLHSDYLDFVVLSHLHEDHANGLENLLRPNLRVGAVFLPYLNPSQRLMVGLKSWTQDPAYFAFLANPTQYLLNRRVNTVVYFRGGGGQEAEENVGEDFPEEPPEENALDQGISGMDDVDAPSPEATPGDPALHSGNVDQKLVSSSLMLGKIWEFRFFNYSVGCLLHNSRIDEVVAAVLQELGVGDPREALDQLADPGIRKGLRSRYGKIARDQNDLSVMLWHGPQQVHRRGRAHAWSHSRVARSSHSRHIEHLALSAGTLLTGDIRLSLNFSDIRDHFRTKWPRTSVVQVPHHGSKHSWHREIARNVPGGSEFVIGAGYKNRYGHPHRSVIVDVLRFHECRYVTECHGFEREMWFHP